MERDGCVGISPGGILRQDCVSMPGAFSDPTSVKDSNRKLEAGLLYIGKLV